MQTVKISRRGLEARFGAYNKLIELKDNCTKRNTDFIRRKGDNLRMNKQELIKRISKQCNIKQYQAKEYLDALTEILTETLLEGGRIKLTELGIFETTQTKEHMWNNPNMNEPVLVPERTKVRFRASETLKKALNDSEV